jgi:hypothetical protein
VRNAILLFACTFVAVIGGLWLYDATIGSSKQEQLLDGVRADSEATRHELDRLAKEQAQMRQTLSKVEEAAAAVELDAASALIRADFATASGSMRTAIAEYYMTTAKMPTANTDAGLPAPTQYRGKTLKSATVTSGGSIEFAFDANSGVDGGRIRLIPDISNERAMGIAWRCETSDYAQIKRALPACEYRSSEARNTPVATEGSPKSPTGS